MVFDESGSALRDDIEGRGLISFSFRVNGRLRMSVHVIDAWPRGLGSASAAHRPIDVELVNDGQPNRNLLRHEIKVSGKIPAREYRTLRDLD